MQCWSTRQSDSHDGVLSAEPFWWREMAPWFDPDYHRNADESNDIILTTRLCCISRQYGSDNERIVQYLFREKTLLQNVHKQKDGDTCLCSRELCNGGISFVTPKFKTLTCQNIIKSSSSLISCLFLIMMFRNYCQTVMTGQAYYVNDIYENSLELIGRRISWQTSI